MDAPVSAFEATTPEKHVAAGTASFLLCLVPVGRERFKGMGGLDEVMARRSCLWGKRLLRASRFLEGEAVAKKPERSSKYQSHHDGLFRAAFNRPDALRCEAEVVLPRSVVRTLDFSRVDMLAARFIDESLRASESDATFRIAQHGRPAFIYVLLEHQRKSDALMPWRLLRYMTNVWLSVLTQEPGRTILPMLVPMVLSNVPGGWRAPTSFTDVLELDDGQRELFARMIPNFKFVLDDLAKATSDELRHRPGPAFTRLALWLLASSSTAERVLDEVPQWADVVHQVRQEAPDDHHRALMYLRKTVYMTEAQAKKMRKYFWMEPDKRVVTVEDIAYAGLKEERAEARAKGREEGLEEGREEGLEKGLKQGQEAGLAVLRSALKDQWAARFGKVPKTASARIEKADASTLKRIAHRLVTAKKAGDVFK
ncbi:MAG: Rpn family recombination-promoting nuclease/putative transposase [Myxococcales bacterium]|nr:Rpn family recombination-promoting nuclease/putative transposase [Myxococcales bacterium]